MVPTAGGSSFPHLSLEIPKSTFLEMLFWNSIQSNCIQTTPKLYQLQCTFTHLKWTLLPEKPRWMWAQITSELLQEWVHHSSTKPEMHKTPLTATLLLPFHVARSSTPAPGKEFSQLCPTWQVTSTLQSHSKVCLLVTEARAAVRYVINTQKKLLWGGGILPQKLNL